MDGPSAVSTAAATDPDLVVLDVMLPGFDGFEVCRRIQAVRPTPVLMLTARNDETDMLVGLGIGADDYLTKPFSMRELVARIRVLLRRVDRAGDAAPLMVGAVAGIRMAARWLPHSVLVAGVATVLGVAAMNPERFIAEHNIDRYQQTGQLDTDYLLSLSPDVEPALARLPEAMRECAHYRDDKSDAWYEFNLSRSRASHAGTTQ